MTFLKNSLFMYNICQYVTGLKVSENYIFFEGDNKLPYYLFSISLKATLLGVNGSSGWLPVPANFKKVWKKRKNFKNLQHLIKFLASYI